MNIGIFGKNFDDFYNESVNNLLKRVYCQNCSTYIYKPFLDFLVEKKNYTFNFTGVFDSYNNLPQDIDFLISIGGDGTFLEAITVIRDSNIPIVGFNSGRLGFLANISSSEVDHALDNLLCGNYKVEERSVISMKSSNVTFEEFSFALNEFTIQKKGPSLITIHVSIDDDYLASYWADGLIIATPTGSTAYSLSVGGPIVTPQSQNFIITPIAAHNLNVRPLIIPDNAILKLSVEGRTQDFQVTLDSRSASIEINSVIHIQKADFSVRMIKLPRINFYSTLYNKLMWGVDKRNY